MKRRAILRSGIGFAGLTGLQSIGIVRAQAKYPDHPIRLIIPFTAGGGTDVLGRRFTNKLGTVLGQQVVVDNKAGADGIIGTTEAARSRPDGYTIMIGTVSTHSLNPVTMEGLPYDPIKDFIAISILGLTPVAIAVHPSGPSNLQELVTLIKANPDKYSYGSAGIGSINHLSAELFKIKAGGLKLLHVPYKGTGQSLVDLMGNQIPIAFVTFSSGLQMHRGGKIRILAVCSEKRSSGAPEIPTAIEAGVPGMVAYTYNVLCTPTGTPPAIVEQLGKATSQVMRDSEFQKSLTAETIEPVVDSSPAAATQFMINEKNKWDSVFKTLGIPKLKA